VEFFTGILETVGPILILLGAGIFIRKKEILSSQQIEGLKTLVVKFALPAALFLTFLKMELKVSLIAFPVFIFLLCLLTYAYGHLRSRRNRGLNPAFPYLMSSFEFGMLGLILFAAAFGRENLGKLAIAGLGQEFFVWFVMIPHVSGIAGNRQSRILILKSFVTNPALMAIFAGLALNLAGFTRWGADLALSRMLASTLDTLSALIVPSVLIFIGYGMVINRTYIREAAGLILQRLAVMALPVGLFIILGINRILNLDSYYSLGILTLFILPPPFVIPLFLNRERQALLPRINGILVLYTVFTIVAFCVLAAAAASFL